MKITKHYVNMVFIFAISFCVPLYAQEDAINKQHVYGQALYERTCAILDESDSNAQKTAENLVHTIMADQEIYALLNIGKNEGFTVTELLTFAKTVAQENEDQEVVEILQNVQENAAKNWFVKNPVITTVGALVVAFGGIIAYLKQEAVIDLFSQLAQKLGFGAQPAPLTEAQRIATEQELARIEAEIEEVKRELAAAEQESARSKAEIEAAKAAELERILELDRELREKYKMDEQVNPEPIDLELGSQTDSSNGADETNSDDVPDLVPAKLEVSPEEPQVSNVVSEEAPVKNLEPAVNLDDDSDFMPDLVPAKLGINLEAPQVSDVTAEVKQVADNTQQSAAQENAPVDANASVLQGAQQQKEDVIEVAPEVVVKKIKSGKVKKEKHHSRKSSDVESAAQSVVEQAHKEQQTEDHAKEEAKKAKRIKHYSGPRYSDSEGKEKKGSRRSSLDPASAKRLAEQMAQLSETTQKAQAEEDAAKKVKQKERKEKAHKLAVGQEPAEASDFVHRVFNTEDKEVKVSPRYRDRIRERSPQSREKSPQSREKSPLRAAVEEGTEVVKEVTGVLDGLAEDGTGNPHNSNSFSDPNSFI